MCLLPHTLAPGYPAGMHAPKTGHLLLLAASITLGGGSLLLFGVFLYLGSFQLLDLGLSQVAVLLFDAVVLSLTFFLQHSLMARPVVQDKLAGHLSKACLPAVYSAASGIALLAVLLLWQRAFPDLIALPPPWSWGLRIPFFAALAFAAWAGRTLGGLDALGIKPILAEMDLSEPPDEPPLVTKGPYRLVRHPMYSATLVIVWSCPEVSGDRLLFNVLWSAWIVAAAKLEEKELTARYGAAYRAYREQVPGLLPWPRP